MITIEPWPLCENSQQVCVLDSFPHMCGNSLNLSVTSGFFFPPTDVQPKYLLTSSSTGGRSPLISPPPHSVCSPCRLSHFDLQKVELPLSVKAQNCCMKYHRNLYQCLFTPPLPFPPLPGQITAAPANTFIEEQDSTPAVLDRRPGDILAGSLQGQQHSHSHLCTI